jgi:hypothetical protein
MVGAVVRGFGELRAWWTQRRSVRVWIHKAFPLGTRPAQLCYFVNVTNLSPARSVEITHVWFEHVPPVYFHNLARPLPKRLAPDESWETWVPVDEIPVDALRDAFGAFRVQLSTGKVIPSRRRRSVPPFGAIPGGLTK